MREKIDRERRGLAVNRQSKRLGSESAIDGASRVGSGRRAKMGSEALVLGGNGQVTEL